jgi:hypothetical protein
LDDLVSGLEEELMAGGGRWIADFNESERDYRLEDVTFDACVRGDTRIKEFGLFSRAMSSFLLPGYHVACYVTLRGTLTQDFLKKCLHIIRRKNETDGVTWSWLVLIVKETPRDEVVRLVESFSDKDLGLVLYDSSSASLSSSQNRLGERMRSYVKSWSKKSHQ